MSTEPETLADMFAAQEASKETATKPDESETTAEAEETTESSEEQKSETEETATEETGDEEESPDSAEFREMLKEQYGYDASRYKTDDAALKGLVEAARTVGVKNELAEYGKAVRDLIKGREEEVVAFLRGETPVAKEPEKQADNDLPTWDEYQLLAIQVRGDDAPVEAKKKYAAVQEAVAKKYLEIARNPEKYLEPLLAKKTAELEKKAIEAARAELGNDRLANTLQSWEAENKTILYANGTNSEGGLTPIGQEIVNLDAELLADGITDPIKRLNRAKQMATAMHKGVTPPPKKIPTKAIRKPAIAPARHDAEKSVQEIINEEPDLLSAVLRMNPSLGKK